MIILVKELRNWRWTEFAKRLLIPWLFYRVFVFINLLISGYYPSNAFDNNPDSIWVSNGVSAPGLNWIAYQFDSPVKVNSIRIQGEADHPDRTPALWYVEASCEKYFKTFSLQWIIENPDHSIDKRYSKPRNSRI